MLEVIEDGEVSNTYTLESQQYTLGRTAINHIVINHDSVSRSHAVLQRNGGGYNLVDNSRHGTFVNGVKIPKYEAIPLRNGDQITLSGSPTILHFCDPLMTNDPPLDLSYNTRTHQYILGGHLLSLTNQERDLLRLLYTNLRQLCSYSSCGYAIWDRYEPDYDRDRLYRVASDLRRKLRGAIGLDPDASDVYPLTSLQGKGYILKL